MVAWLAIAGIYIGAGTLLAIQLGSGEFGDWGSGTLNEDVGRSMGLVAFAIFNIAISIGTSHGAYKFKPGTDVPPLRFDILEDIEKRIPGFPIVLHGASSVVPKYVDMINSNGGALKDAVGIPADQLRKAAKSAVCKINIDSDGRLAMTAMIRQVFAEKPAEFDPRKYMGAARGELIEMVKHKNINVLGSANRI